ncbi:ATP-dependent zinc metalloprotease FtsH [Desulfurivibrio sp. D14AmB]|uniref:ATP-dependent zinc metalloprotease FtsH n=1 Tax=Desulfurivibrio sp. D14AmB TaxID=3374370 RepID=UPI00376EE0A5
MENRLSTLSYNEFVLLLEKDEIREVHLAGNNVTLHDIYDRQFKTYTPDPDGLADRLLAKSVKVYGASDHSDRIWNLLTIAIPVLLIMIVWFMMNRRNTQTESSADFAKSRAVMSGQADRIITFRDVAGIPEARDELLEIVDFLQKPKKYSRLGAIIPKGVLFLGPPGTGKTLLAKAIAGEAGVPFFSINGSDFVEKFVGVGASRVRDLFREAKKNSPCIVFIDEIDAVGGHRAGAGSAGGQEERGQTLNALLVEMDGFGSHEKVIVIAATNRPDILDPALLRPGRFDRIITILPPDVKGRRAILDVHTRNIKLAPDVNLDDLARVTPGFTGAELASLVNEAALIAGRTEKDVIDQDDLDMAKDRILMGIERKGLVIDEQDKRSMACHEAGHAIVAWILPDTDPLHKISIIPRGKAMGSTQQQPIQDRYAYTDHYLRHRLAIIMGGRAAEEVLLGQISTGAEGDLAQAVELATNMVCKWGMSEKVGPLAYFKANQGFLGGPTAQNNFSEETARLIDSEVRSLVEEGYRCARAILDKERRFLDQLTESLLEAETIDRQEMQIIHDCTQREQHESQGACENRPHHQPTGVEP